MTKVIMQHTKQLSYENKLNELILLDNCTFYKSYL